MQGDGFVMDSLTEDTPPIVPWHSGVKQGGEIRAHWAWVEPAVWTERMLAALEEGVKGGDHQRWLTNPSPSMGCLPDSRP